MSYDKISLPHPLTDYHYSMEYLSQLVGKKILDGTSGRELEIKSVNKILYEDADSSKRVCNIEFKTSYESYNFRIASFELIALIHSGWTPMDARMGYVTKIIK